MSKSSRDPLNYELSVDVSAECSTSPISTYDCLDIVKASETSICLDHLALDKLLLKLLAVFVRCVNGNDVFFIISTRLIEIILRLFRTCKFCCTTITSYFKEFSEAHKSNSFMFFHPWTKQHYGV
jgi:hypothetical protein